MTEASGHFKVDITPAATFAEGVGRFAVVKTFEGDLEGTGTGEMLAFRTATPGSAGYVLIEHVSATLGGRRGSFKLQHSGVMDRGAARLDCAIIPDSGTEDLAGIAGTMRIDASADHAYVLSYRLPDAG